MTRDLISNRTSLALREVLNEFTLREIEVVFEGAGIKCPNPTYVRTVPGSRRLCVDQHLASLKVQWADDAERLLKVTESTLKKSIQRDAEKPSILRSKLPGELIESLQADGFAYDDGFVFPVSEDARKSFWRERTTTISKITRKNLKASLHPCWWGELPELEFLDRIYNLQALRSNDPRVPDAGGDVCQHRLNNSDWEDDWIFFDDRFHLMDKDVAFLIFLCETVHPVVHPNEDEAREMAKSYNDHLVKEGWELYEADVLIGKPIFKARRTALSGLATHQTIRALAERLDADYIKRQVSRMTETGDRHPDLAVGTAKEVIETICRTILAERGAEIPHNPSLMDLTKATFGALQLMPEQVPDAIKGSKIIKKIVCNMISIIEEIEDLRDLYGTGHGKDGRTFAILPRHANLVVGSASTLVVFLYETHRQKLPTLNTETK
jgi:hypothetical protein